MRGLSRYWNSELYGAIICDPLAGFLSFFFWWKYKKPVKCLPQHILGLFFFFLTVFTVCTWNLCKNFPEINPHKQIPKVACLESTLRIIAVTTAGDLLRNLAA